MCVKIVQYSYILLSDKLLKPQIISAWINMDIKKNPLF